MKLFKLLSIAFLLSFGIKGAEREEASEEVESSAKVAEEPRVYQFSEGGTMLVDPKYELKGGVPTLVSAKVWNPEVKGYVYTEDPDVLKHGDFYWALPELEEINPDTDDDDIYG